MSELSGEKIEDLLWNAGCELEHVEDDEGFLTIHIPVGDSIIVLSEPFFEDDEWFIDSDNLVLEKIVEGEKVDEDLSVPVSEEDLVQSILELGGDE